MKTFFQSLFEYNHNVNRQLWEVMNAHADKTSEKAIRLYNHILNGHQIWNNRIEQRDAVPDVWYIHSLPVCRDLDLANYQHTLDIIRQFDLDDVIRHPKIKGKPFSKKISEVLFHVVNHSTYHRGQIATEFRQSGLEPVMTDFIFYERKGSE
ncbi:Uncharacterized damage-inducible protein DinB (forms a four-helix bundle) [Chitinophaga eiseniae]|uniref:Uncharacterized damage-inducible protein DinB (Forms a four-helix bundle) n=1 Tax=Chitinophaga eiseniae TaxID=634771 RepID=A0A1T4TYN9_9BACT|nr:DinB family protein [Chitinophaga eiseniae]SKA45565.1 Uncharacterized damage-inducible protein DinB (forms a four-helix bundle) [Chitinophaga eiseniae]